MEPAIERQPGPRSSMDVRVERLIDAHGGDPVAAIETLLAALDYRADQIAYGYVRGRLRR